VTDDEKVLIFCHAGCTIDEVVGALDLRLSDLFPSAYALRHGKRKGIITPGQRTTQDAELEVPSDSKHLTEFHQASRPGKGLAPLAKEWGLPLDAVKRLEIGTDRGRWVIPERSGAGTIVGISFRHSDGQKTCLPGSQRGLIIPTDTMPVDGAPLYLAEGASDTAALISIGATAIGRPAAYLTRRAFARLTYLLMMRRFDDVIVMADRDDVGKEGAATLASQLKQHNPNWRVRWALPRKGYKDIREQIVAGQWDRGLIEKEVLQ
jgi:hypothetical protein